MKINIFNHVKCLKPFPDWEKISTTQRQFLLQAIQVLYNDPLILQLNGNRLFTLGFTDNEQLLFSVFSLAAGKLRLLTVRQASLIEQEIYERQKVTP